MGSVRDSSENWRGTSKERGGWSLNSSPLLGEPPHPPASHRPTLLPLMKLVKGGEEWKYHQERPHFGLHSLTSKKTLEPLVCI